MMKKLAVMAGAGALLLGMAVPAFAWGGWWGGGSDVAIVNNSAVAGAYTGENEQGNTAGSLIGSATVGGNNSMTTGGATAYAGALVVANTHIGCGPCAGGGWGHKDFALVGNDALALADSGLNDQGNEAMAFVGSTTAGGNNSITTGDADSTARAWTIVNTHWGH